MIINNQALGNKKDARLLKWFGWIRKYTEKNEYCNMREFKCISIYPNHIEWKSAMDKWIISNEQEQ